jgi:hypothetical protein
MGRAATGNAAGGQRKQESDDVMAGIGQDFPGWHPWRSSAERWWAVRRAAGPPPPGAPAEWARTVDADTPEGLRAVLAVQEGLTGHAPR